MHLQAKVCKIKVSFKVMSVISSSMLLDSSSLSMLLCAESIRTACWHIILGYVSLHMPTTSRTFCALFSCEPLYCSEMLQDKVIVLCIQFCAFTWKLIHTCELATSFYTERSHMYPIFIMIAVYCGCWHCLSTSPTNESYDTTFRHTKSNTYMV